MAIPSLVGDALPLGRHPANLAEIQSTFLDASPFTASISRPVIWSHFETATQLLQAVVEVHAAWIGGSFTTTKLNPRDIDVLYLVSGEDRARRSSQERRTIEAFVNRKKDPLSSRVVPEHGLLVDSFVLDWYPYLPPRSSNDPYQLYAGNRGYWDDWWTRRRASVKGDPPVREDALPRRGYLEVQFDAYA